ncbi:MAG: recombinase family protein [Rhodobacteraceae bacterium]|nr:recombinase family protein [Paracoccaceae bacterium]
MKRLLEISRTGWSTWWWSTRSTAQPLAGDFAKLVEVFDRNGVTFVSVTQSFNTTTSMGRLTLNILLSFAQFEREVTPSASATRSPPAGRRACGWAGCRPTATGGKPEAGSRREAAAHVRWIFARFLEIGSCTELAREVGTRGIRTRAATGSTRNTSTDAQQPRLHRRRGPQG